MVGVAQGRGVTQDNGNASVTGLYLRLGEERIGHLREHTRDAFSLVTRQAKVHQRPNDTGIAAVVNLRSSRSSSSRVKVSATSDPGLATSIRSSNMWISVQAPMSPVITVRHCVEQCFKPSEIRVFGSFLKTVAH